MATHANTSTHQLQKVENTDAWEVRNQVRSQQKRKVRICRNEKKTNRAGMAARVSGAPPFDVTSGVDFSSPANDIVLGVAGVGGEGRCDAALVLQPRRKRFRPAVFDLAFMHEYSLAIMS